MSVFGTYARYYDLLYKDKDYTSEALFVESLLARHAPRAQDILELGCGTGSHARLLAEKGYALHGVDLSDEMLEVARERRAALPPELQERLSFSAGNARDCRVGREFDAVVSLFHVVSYQSTNTDLHAMFETAALHLKPGGVFVFDFWYGPAVLSDRPSVRVKRMESTEIQVTRVAEPTMHARKNCVDVHYHILIRDKDTNAVQELKETHRMRYLFSTEIEMLARAAGLRVEESCEWLSGAEPGFDTWGVCAVLSK
jgi:SAM-dependent methyltransferase